jgi:hypothetical protein
MSKRFVEGVAFAKHIARVQRRPVAQLACDGQSFFLNRAGASPLWSRIGPLEESHRSWPENRSIESLTTIGGVDRV